MLRREFVLAGLAALATAAAAAQEAGPAGQTWSIESAHGDFTVDFAPDGRVQDSRGGGETWHFDGRTLCVRTRGQEICEPWRGLSVGESYMSRAWSNTREPVRVTRIA
ncbi:hypothetical protein E5163_10975 [Marinicauda algicola]|uniref:Dihydrodipicolinate reductase n=1 Tax=Marinicauda algicola TaxID=2029849 RepID=A0A4S2GYX6_9PROT|nr:hypothetical protein [Marinicauda algicola]TGY88336.1 hypothetical protein E5163_10975 [Marinicauda algicola]